MCTFYLAATVSTDAFAVQAASLTKKSWIPISSRRLLTLSRLCDRWYIGKYLNCPVPYQCFGSMLTSTSLNDMMTIRPDSDDEDDEE